MPAPAKRLDFRIPISPTPSFFSQVQFYNFALRRLGPTYADARLSIVVGDRCDLDQVRRQNRWSESFNVVWERVPDDICLFGPHGTANWRYSLPTEDIDIVILSDADTVLMRDIDPLFSELPSTSPAVRGHMAHFPPPINNSGAPSSRSPDFWPWLFGEFDIKKDLTLHRYSIDSDNELPMAPAYFNLGFVALTAVAVPIFNREIINAERRIMALTESFMRCQIAVTMIAHKHDIDIDILPASYNAANDLAHLSNNNLSIDDIRVMHYLRSDEIDRSNIFLRQNIDNFITRELKNPINVALQTLAREYRHTMI